MVSRPVDPTYEPRPDVRFLLGVVGLYGRAFQNRRVLSPCTVPSRGPAVVASNHTAGLDPIAIQSTCPRPIVWIMTREYYDLPSLRWFLAYCEMIPIDRGGRDSAAWRAALKMLKAGRVVGVFPEGRIETTRDLLPLQTGVAYLAKRGGADLFPVWVDGVQRNGDMLGNYLARREPAIAWGDRVPAGTGKGRDDLQETTDALRDRLLGLAARFPSPRRRGRSALSRREAS